MAQLKRLASPLAPERKKKKFIIAPRGKSKKNSIALGVIIRDFLKLAENYREAKKIIKQGLVLVDGRPCKDHKFGLSIMDVIQIPLIKKSFRVVPAKNGLGVIEISNKESKLKLCKIIGKRVLKKGIIQLNLHDGRNILADNSYHTHGSLLIEIPKQKIKEYLKMEKGMLALIISGKNKTKIAKISNVERGWKKNRVWFGEEEAPLDAVMIVGKNKPLITINGEKK